MNAYIIQTGLTRRLAYGSSEHAVRLSFIESLCEADKGFLRREFHAAPEEIIVRLASDEEVEEFEHRRRPRRGPVEGQIQWDLPDKRKDTKARGA